MLINATLKTGKRWQETELTGRTALREEEEEEEEEEKKEKEKKQR